MPKSSTVKPFLWLSGDCWDDIRAPASTVSIFGFGTDPTYGVFRGSTYAYLFSQGDILRFDFQLPHTYLEESDIHPHVHWSPMSGNPADDGDVVWLVDYTWANRYDIFPAPSAATTGAETVASADQYRHVRSELTTPLSGTSKTISSMIKITLERGAGGDGDTYGGAVALHEVDVHFQINSLGSRFEYVK